MHLDTPRSLYFPQELSAIVIGNLAGSQRALCACSLVCRAWVPLGRRHLFREVSLNFCRKAPGGAAPEWDDPMCMEADEEDEASLKIGEGETTNGDMALHVEDDDGELENEDEDDGAYIDVGHKAPRPGHATEFMRLLASPHCTVKPHIQRAHLSYLDGADESIGKDPPAAILHAFTTLPALRALELEDTRLSPAAAAVLVAGFPRITALALRSVRLRTDLWTLAARFPGLTTLDISASHWMRAADAPPPAPLVLDTLVATSCGLARLLTYVADRPAGLLTARTLHIASVRAQDVPVLAALQRLRGVTALHVAFDDVWCHGHLPTAFAAAIDLSAHPALATLALADYDEESPPDVVEALPALLARAPAGLARVAITLNVSICDVATFPWAVADAALAGRSGLRAVEVELFVGVGVARRKGGQVAKAVRSFLPEVGRRGILEVTVN